MYFKSILHLPSFETVPDPAYNSIMMKTDLVSADPDQISDFSQSGFVISYPGLHEEIKVKKELSIQI